ncbi:hypothetical protein L227DRAFT_575218, partial [Lentinus tigrinus ALCF2SS1-6]
MLIADKVCPTTALEFESIVRGSYCRSSRLRVRRGQRISLCTHTVYLTTSTQLRKEAFYRTSSLLRLKVWRICQRDQCVPACHVPIDEPSLSHCEIFPAPLPSQKDRPYSLTVRESCADTREVCGLDRCEPANNRTREESSTRHGSCPTRLNPSPTAFIPT